MANNKDISNIGKLVLISECGTSYDGEYGVIVDITPDYETKFDYYVDVQHRVDYLDTWFRVEKRERIAFKWSELIPIEHMDQAINVGSFDHTPESLGKLAYEIIGTLTTKGNWLVDTLPKLMASVPTAMDYRLGLH